MVRQPNPWRRLLAGVEQTLREIVTIQAIPRLPRAARTKLEALEQELVTLLRLSKR